MGWFSHFFKELEHYAAPILDVAAVATGNPELLPLAQAAGSTISAKSQGASLGEALKGGAVSGLEALAGQEALGAIGIGQGNTAFNNVIGWTGDNPAGTGLPDVGGFLSNAAGEAGQALGLTSSGAAGDTVSAAPVQSVTSNDLSPPAAPASTAPASAVAFGAAPISASGVEQAGQAAVESQVGGSTTSATTGTDSILSPEASRAIGGQNALPWNGVTPQESTFLNDAANSAATTNASGNIVSSAAPSSGSSSLLDKALKYGPSLGGLAYEAIKGPGKLPSSAQALQAGGAATAPLLATEQAALNEYNSGQLTPGQQATVAKNKNDYLNQVIQQLANEGVTDIQHDSRYIAAVQQADRQSLIDTQTFLDSALTAGTQAGGAASQNLAQAANAQISQDNAFQQALTGAVQGLAGVAGGGIDLNALLKQKAAA